MLQKLRDKTSGWIAIVVIGILIIPFAFFGVTDYFTGGADTWVAKVGKHEISQQDFSSRFEEHRSQMRQMLGERYDSSLVESAETRTAVLNRLVDEELLRQAATEQGIVISPAQLQSEIGKIGAFQIDGQFNVDQYRMLLAGQNMSPREFERRILRDLETRSIPLQIEASALVTNADVERFVALRDQRRDLRFVLLDPPEIDADEVSDEALEAFHRENSARYMTEEQVSIEYIQLDASTLDVPTVADEETLQKRYEEGSSRFVEPEQRLASHILIKTAADADADAQREAQAKAQALVEQARAEGADFSALATANTEDVGSKANGGDLGWLERGFTDPAFETVLFAMEPGTISEPVKSAEGWHVIQLRELRAEKRKAFADVRGELEREFLETERERRFNELSGQMVDALYRDPSTLVSAAKVANLEVVSAGPFSRLGGADAITSHPNVIAAAFAPRAISERTVSELIELEATRYVALRVVEHVPAAPIALADIRDQVLTEYRQDQRGKAMEARAQALLDRLLAGESLDALAAELEVTVGEAMDIGRGGGTVDAAISTEAFAVKHPAADAPVSAKVALGGDRHALLQVTAVRDGDASTIDETQRNAVREQLAQTLGNAETLAYVAALRKQIEVKLAPERL